MWMLFACNRNSRLSCRVCAVQKMCRVPISMSHAHRTLHCKRWHNAPDDVNDAQYSYMCECWMCDVQCTHYARRQWNELLPWNLHAQIVNMNNISFQFAFTFKLIFAFVARIGQNFLNAYTHTDTHWANGVGFWMVLACIHRAVQCAHALVSIWFFSYIERSIYAVIFYLKSFP